MAQPTISWPITPVKKQSPSKCHVLIEQELSEDSSDEEYRPNDEEQEQVLERIRLKNGAVFYNKVLHNFDLISISCFVHKGNVYTEVQFKESYYEEKCGVVVLQAQDSRHIR